MNTHGLIDLMPARPIVVGVMLALALLGCAQKAPMDVAIGSVLTPGNTQVPMPPGDWKKLAEYKSTGGRQGGGGTTNLHSVEVWYGLIENNHIKSIISIYSSADSTSPYGYDPNSFCVPKSNTDNIYLHDVDGISANYSDCIKVHKSNFGPPSDSASPGYKEAYPAIIHMGGVPRNSVRVVFSNSLAYRYVNLHVYFFPERDGIEGNSWDAGAEGSAEKAYVRDIVSWAKKFRPAVRNGTQNLLQ